METAAFLGLLILLTAALLAARAHLKSIIVYEYQAGLKFQKGKLLETLAVGKHWYLKSSTEIRIVDLRTRNITVPGQEVLTSDGVSLKVSLAAEYRIQEPRLACTEIDNYLQALYLHLQLALRQVISTRPIDDLLALRGEFGPRVKELCVEPASAIGLELVSTDVKDIMFPGALKKIFTQVVQARNEGLAALEKARGETAALRQLANAARMVEKNPHLMQLRLLHSLTESNAGTLVVNLTPEPAPPPPARPSKKVEKPGRD